MALITKGLALEHLRLGEGQYDEHDFALKMEQATAHVITYLKRPEHEWTDETDPATDPEFAIVQGAILEVLSNLFFDRGDRDKPSDGPVTPRVRNALSMLRDPSLA